MHETKNPKPMTEPAAGAEPATQDHADRLRQVELFASLDEPQLALVASRVQAVSFPAGHIIVREGEVGSGMYLVVRGRVRVLHHGHGVTDYGPGEYFGELSLIDQQPRIASVQALEATDCLALASWDLTRLLEEHPPVTVALLRETVRRLRATTRQRTD